MAVVTKPVPLTNSPPALTLLCNMNLNYPASRLPCRLVLLFSRSFFVEYVSLVRPSRLGLTQRVAQNYIPKLWLWSATNSLCVSDFFAQSCPAQISVPLTHARDRITLATNHIVPCQRPFLDRPTIVFSHLTQKPVFAFREITVQKEMIYFALSACHSFRDKPSTLKQHLTTPHFSLHMARRKLRTAIHNCIRLVRRRSCTKSSQAH